MAPTASMELIQNPLHHTFPWQCLEHCRDNPWRRGLMPPDRPHESCYPLIPTAELALPDAVPSNTIINELNRPITAETSLPNLHYPHHAMII